MHTHVDVFVQYVTFCDVRGCVGIVCVRLLP